MAQAPADLVKPVSAPGTLKSLEDLPSIEDPDERNLRWDKSDQDMFNELVLHFGDRLSTMYYDLFICFIQGYAHEKERKTETIKRIEHFLERNKEYNIPQILDSEAKDDAECLDAWPVYIYGYDKQGHPIMWDEIPSSTVEKVKKTFGNDKGEPDYEKLRQFRFRFLRRLENSKIIQKKRYNKDIYRHVMVMDMVNFSRHHVMQPMRDIVATVIGDESNLWPNTLQKMFIINAPFAFRWGWSIIKAFVHPITAAKINILGSDFLKEMTKHIDINQIPKKYGGKCDTPIDYGYVADVDHDVINVFFKEYTMGEKVINKDKKNNNESNQEDQKDEDNNDQTNENAPNPDTDEKAQG